MNKIFDDNEYYNMTQIDEYKWHFMKPEPYKHYMVSFSKILDEMPNNERERFEYVNQLLENATHISEGNTDHVHQKQMTVSINGTAFIESGVGKYKIPIPLRFELIK